MEKILEIFQNILIFFHLQVSTKMQIVSVSEFATPQPFLSMSIIDATVRKVDREGHTASDLESEADEDDDSDDDFMDGHHGSSRNEQLTK